MGGGEGVRGWGGRKLSIHRIRFFLFPLRRGKVEFVEDSWCFFVVELGEVFFHRTDDFRNIGDK